MIPFWPKCYDINSDMGAHLMPRAPALLAEMSDPNLVFRKYGTAPTDLAGRQRIATEGPSLYESFQAALNAVHPLMGRDDVAKTMWSGGKELLVQLKRQQLLPDARALEGRIKTAAAQLPWAEGALEKLGLILAPFALKYGKLGTAISGTVKAGALAGASVLIYGAFQYKVQELLGMQMNELHATSGSLAEKARPAPWEGYQPGDWVSMRVLEHKIFKAHVGLVLSPGYRTGSRYKRYDVAVLPTSDIVGREAGDLVLLDQNRMAAAVQKDPKLELWKAAMPAKLLAERSSCPVSVGTRRRMTEQCEFVFRPIEPVPKLTPSPGPHKRFEATTKHDEGYGPVRPFDPKMLDDVEAQLPPLPEDPDDPDDASLDEPVSSALTWAVVAAVLLVAAFLSYN